MIRYDMIYSDLDCIPKLTVASLVHHVTSN